MKVTPKWFLAAVAVCGALIAGTGAALANGGHGFPGFPGFGHEGGASQTTVLNAVAVKLGVQPAALRTAVKDVLKAQVDQQVKDGNLTPAQATAIKDRIANGSVHIGVGPPDADIGLADAAAAYLGLTPAALHTALEGGKSLADVAKDKGKTVDGLKAAILAKATTNLAAAVAAGDLTAAQRDAALTRLKSSLDDIVTHTHADGPRRGGPPPGFRPHLAFRR